MIVWSLGELAGLDQGPGVYLGTGYLERNLRVNHSTLAVVWVNLKELKVPQYSFLVFFSTVKVCDKLQCTDYALEAPPPLLAHAYLRGVQLRPACVTQNIWSALRLEPE